MKKSFITTIIALLTLSLIGIVVLQGLWINNAWQTKQEDFDRSVSDALNNVVQLVERREAVSFISHRYELHPTQDFYYQQSSAIRISSHGAGDSLFVFQDILPFAQKPDLVHRKQSGKKEFGMSATPDSNGIHYAVDDSKQVMMGEVTIDTLQNGSYEKRVSMKASQLNDIIYQMVAEWSSVQVPIEQRLQPAELYEAIKVELTKKGINLPFQFAVVTGKNDSICRVKSTAFSSTMVPASFRADLFPNDIFLNPYQLLLHFNTIRPYFIKSLWWMLLLSAIFLLLIIATFSSAIYIILKQKKVSEIKTDFINNMTHELKTPIATISVAIDAINNPKILDNKERIRYYSRIISNENKRMNAHVENILQMALVDKENFELNEQLLDVHEIILRVVDPVRMQIGNRNGKLNLQLNADNAYVVADEIHLTNVIYNLIDNAIKYSPHDPDITIRTENGKGGVMISVEDKGIGMSADTQRKVFEKFYREENGNIHNVKGFGLGLAYVKAIVKKHGGGIKVKSEPGKGSQFEVYLPFGHFQGMNNAILTDPKV